MTSEITSLDDKGGALAYLDRAMTLIANAKSIDEACVLKAQFKAVEIEARRTKAIEVEKKAVEYKFWTMDKLGALLQEMKKTGQRASAGQFTENQYKEGSASGVSTLKRPENIAQNVLSVSEISQSATLNT